MDKLEIDLWKRKMNIENKEKPQKRGDVTYSGLNEQPFVDKDYKL